MATRSRDEDQRETNWGKVVAGLRFGEDNASALQAVRDRTAKKYRVAANVEPVVYTVTNPEGTKKKKTSKPVVAAIVLTVAGLLPLGYRMGQYRAEDMGTGQTPQAVVTQEPDALETADGGRIEHARNIQIGEAFSRDTKDIEVQVKAVPQPGAYMMTSTCLINGRTDDGAWYQWGLRYRDDHNFYITENIWDGSGKELVLQDFYLADCKPGDNVSLEDAHRGRDGDHGRQGPRQRYRDKQEIRCERRRVQGRDRRWEPNRHIHGALGRQGQLRREHDSKAGVHDR